MYIDAHLRLGAHPVQGFLSCVHSFQGDNDIGWEEMIYFVTSEWKLVFHSVMYTSNKSWQHL